MEAAIKHYRAVQAAIRTNKPKIQPIDWDILIVLYEAKKPMSVDSITLSFTSNHWSPFVSRYYDSLARLEKVGFVDLTNTKKWHRRWQINMRGIMAINLLDKVAARILKSA